MLSYFQGNRVPADFPPCREPNLPWYRKSALMLWSSVVITTCCSEQGLSASPSAREPQGSMLMRDIDIDDVDVDIKMKAAITYVLCLLFLSMESSLISKLLKKKA